MNSLSKILIALILFTASFAIVQAQVLDTLWTKTYENVYDYGNGYHLITTLDDGFAVAATKYDRAYLMKMNSDGDTVWTKYCRNVASYGTAIVQTEAGDFIVTGQHEELYMFMQKVNSQGEIVWTRTIDGYDGCHPYDLIETEDNCLVFCGKANEFLNDSPEMILYKTDTSGNQIFARVYDQYESARGHSVVETVDHGYMIAARVRHTFPGQYYTQIIKTDSNGNIQWTNDYEEGSWVNKIIRTEDGNYVFTGNKADNGSFVIKIDGSGNTVWTRDFYGSNYLYFSDIKETSDSGFIIIGSSFPYLGENTDLTIYKIDNQGNFIWNGVIIREFPVAGQSIDLNENGGAYFAGYSETSDYHNRGVIVGRLVDGAMTSVDRNYNIANTYEIMSVYPNPFNPSTTISLALPDPTDLSVKVFSQNGRQVSVLADGQYGAGNHTFLFDGSNLSSGTYFIQAVAPGISSDVKRVMLVK